MQIQCYVRYALCVMRYGHAQIWKSTLQLGKQGRLLLHKYAHFFISYCKIASAVSAFSEACCLAPRQKKVKICEIKLDSSMNINNVDKR